MPLEIVTVPCLSDNYAYLLHDSDSGETAVVDVPEAAPIKAALDERGWTLGQILITHHHPDHIQGVAELLDAHPAKVVGHAQDAKRLPPLDISVNEGDSVSVGSHKAEVIDVSGHTVGHIAFVFRGENAAFTADSLMVMGCGRLFEGSPEMMWDSLQKLLRLPPETRIYSGHEYTRANADFALSIEPENSALKSRSDAIDAARADGKPTVPATLGQELETNPFLRATTREMRDALDMAGADDTAVFAELRRRKDSF